MKFCCYGVFFLFLVFIPAVVFGVEHNSQVKHKAPLGVESLSKDLRHLLSKEMQAIQAGMISIIPAYVSGNWSAIETTAGKIKKSYILKQSLSMDQIKELHTSLPKEFITKDKRFHYLAGMLEHAAKNNKSELINFYFSEMNESCVSCHSVFAIHRFPELKIKPEKEHNH